MEPAPIKYVASLWTVMELTVTTQNPTHRFGSRKVNLLDKHDTLLIKHLNQ